jgi:adenosylcobinamide-GDP ribazoletransferase
LEIMRDSRIGSHGAVALVLVLTLKWAALERCLALGDRSWLAAPVLARLLCTVQLNAFPYARREGLGSSFRGRVGFGSVVLSAGALLPAFALFGPPLTWTILAGAAVSLGFARRVQRRLGGLTGDVYGAGIELSETAALIAAALHLP